MFNRDLQPSIGAQLTGCSVLPRDTASLSVFQLLPEPVQPQWVYDAGATEYHLQDGSGLSMPIPWDTAFQTKWLAFVRTMGQRSDGNPALRYVVISGLGQLIETRLAKTTADNNALTALGGPPAWEAAAQQIIAA